MQRIAVQRIQIHLSGGNSVENAGKEKEKIRQLCHERGGGSQAPAAKIQRQETTRINPQRSAQKQRQSATTAAAGLEQNPACQRKVHAAH